MKHNLTISVSKKPVENGIVSCKVLPVKSKKMREYLGGADKMTLIIPGDSVKDITIREVNEGGEKNDSNKS